ncbi:MAG: hypothetical protein F4Y78_04975 [Candidatus Dadabacteria bacterium]|nr:hypothetical protein [Candidatus Dadabacteria bacterium]MYA47909.1 hypothetical protein [Candidatus Dadabacteria bacterium]MYG83074.1 hypothetical protein [Candidatus Dadabacteria bacterium]MYK49311.1 hypothetical protein [Candidatus Dadabacteria bacterium]
MERFFMERETDLELEKQFEVSDVARESGLMIRIFVTSLLKKELMVPDSEASARGEDESTRLKEILSPLVSSIRATRKTKRTNIINFSASVTKDGKGREFQVISYLGPVTKDSEEACITLLLPEDLPEETP